MRFSALAIALSVLFSGCSQAEPTTNPTPEPTIQIVASTNVWGSIAKSIGGDMVTVEPIISSFAQDPHSYEASARDQLAVSKADLVVANGGGYDPFIEALAKAADDKEILFAYTGDTAQQKQDKAHDHTHENEHVWYDFHVVEDFANRLVAKLTELDPTNSYEYSDNLILFLDKIQILEDQAAKLSGIYGGEGVISSEPVADYLLEAIGLVNLTPESFSQAIEEELDVSPKALLEVREIIESGKINLFVSNLQTGSTQVNELANFAKANKVSVIELSELLPQGYDYFEWMQENLATIEVALR